MVLFLVANRICCQWLMMKPGDLVKADNYLPHIGGSSGIIIEMQNVRHCIGAYVLFDNAGVKLIRVENLTIIQSSNT